MTSYFASWNPGSIQIFSLWLIATIILVCILALSFLNDKPSIKKRMIQVALTLSSFATSWKYISGLLL
jgi:hypothetical protein